MPVELPTDDDGKLVAFDEAAVAALGLMRRGVKAEHDHVRYTFSPQGSGCTRRFKCHWDQRFNAAIYLAGACASYIDSGSGVRKLSRLMPQRDPDYPEWACTKVEVMPWRFLSNLDLTGVADPEDADQIDAVNPGYKKGMHVPVFDRAELVATFEQCPWSFQDDDELSPSLGEQGRYVTWPGYPGADVSAEANYIGLPGSTLWYATADGTVATGPAGTPIPFPVGFVEMTGKVSAVWRRVPLNVWGAATALFNRLIGTETTRGYIGSLNKTEFRGYPPLSLQLIGIEQRLLPDPTGIGYSWDLRYFWAHAVKPFGHTGLYFHDVKTSGSQSGYYQALRPAAGRTRIDAASLGDNDAMFHVREHADLFKPGV